MTKNFQRELDKIKKAILSLGALVEERVRMAIRAVEQKDADIADQIIELDLEIDDMEVEIEEECLKVMALHQPVAVDLRFLTAVIKINNDLERIGDESVNIAERVKIIAKMNQHEFVFDYSTMADKTQLMLQQSLDALVNMDTDLAFKTLLMDDEVDKINRDAYIKIKDAMEKNSNALEFLINLLFISRHLERVADHATNIAEEVIYMIEGEIVRHGKF